MFLGQLDCTLEIGGVCVNFNTVGKHPLGKRTDFMALVKHGLKGVVNFGKQVFCVVGTPNQLGTLQPLKEFRF